MSIINHNKSFKSFQKAPLFFFILLGLQMLYGQYTVNGPSPVNVNEVKRYTIGGSGPSIGSVQWAVNGGTKTAESSSWVDVRWTSPGTGRSVIANIFYASNPSYPSEYPSRSVTVLSNDPPTVYTLSNNGASSVCDNEGSVRLSDSQVGATYRLYRNGSAFGLAISGTNNALTWNNLTPGTYTSRATMNGQTVTMNGSVTISSLTANPIQISVAGNPNLNAICPNTQIVLSSNGTGHSWSGVDGYITGNNPAYVTLSPGQTRTITVTANNSCGDSDSDTVTLRAESALGNVTFSSGATQVCQNAPNTDYNASAANAASYVWSISPTAAGTINSNGTVNWSASYIGNATITARAETTCGQSRTGTRTVTVNPPPSSYNVSAPANVCTSGTVTLADSQTGVNYRLFRGTTPIGSARPGTGNALSWTGATPGTYRIEATRANGTCSTVNMNNQVTIGSQTADPIQITVAGNPNLNAICPNTQIVLSSNGTGHSWSGVDGYITGTNPAYVTLSPGQTRTITVTANNSCGESDTDTVTLTAESAPGNVTFSSGATQVCQNAPDTDYNASAANAASYVWSISPTAAGTINSNGTVNWSASYIGNATITARAETTCGQSRTGTRTVTVNPPPSVYNVSAPANVCTSGTVTLADSQTGVNYQLFRNDVESGSAKPGTGNALSWTGATPGTYRIEATRANGTCSTVNMNNQVTIGSQTADPIQITVAGNPNLNAICPNTQIVLSSNGTGHSWSGVDGYITGTNPAYVTLSPGQTRTITVTANNSCGESDTDTVTLTAESAPGNVTFSSGATQVCQNAPDTDYNASAANAASYVWSISPTAAGTINSNGTVNWSASYIGNATITARAETTCGQSRTGTRTVTVNPPPSVYNVSAPANVCTSGTVTLADSQTGVNYQLFRNDVESGSAKPGTGNALSWTGATPGTYRIEATRANGTCSTVNMNNQVTIGSQTADPIQITVAGNPDLNAVCPNTQIVLSSNGTGHSWSGVDGYITGTNPAYVTLSPGQTRTITVTANNSCGESDTDTVTLTAESALGNVTFLSGATQVCQDAPDTDYNASAANAANYIWSISPTIAGSIDENGTVDWSASYTGDATITVRAESACGQSDTETRTVTVTTQITYYEDRDRDGFYVNTVTSCSNPDTDVYVTADFVTGSGDCNDNNAGLNPNTTWYLDADGDGHAVSSQQSCTSPGENYVLSVFSTSDCDDTDEDVNIQKTWFIDADGDGYPLENSFTTACENPGIALGNPDDYGSGNYFDIDCDDTTFDISNNCEPLDPSTATGANYVYSRSYQVSRSSATDFGESDEGLIQNITYFDGLGRTIQQIALEQSPKDAAGIKKDIVTQMKYDGFGRMPKEWLPAPMDIGNFSALKTGVENAILGHYATDKYENTANPYSEKSFEQSPLSRVLKQAAPGNDWALGQGHEIEFGYATNTVEDGVKQMRVITNPVTENGVITYETTLVESTAYPAGQLLKSVTYDENHSIGSKNHSTEEFTNKEGQVILKRTYEGEVPHDTYYVYDNFGNLSFVLPPKMDASTANLTAIQDGMDDLGYKYTYDYRNRLVVKKLPGKGEEHIVYNRLDQPVMTQDANLRGNGEWLYTKYDAFGRVAYTGMLDETQTRTQLQNLLDSDTTSPLWEEQNTNGTLLLDGINVYYGNQSHPKTGFKELHTVNYYDTYNTARDGMPISATALGVTSTANVQGLPTVTMVKVLGTDDFITTATYYDDKGRPIYTRSENDYLATLDVVETELDFVGRPIKTKAIHNRNGNTIVTIDNFNYDHVGRLLSHTQCIGDLTLGNNCPTGGGGSAPSDPVIENETVTTDRVATQSITIRPVTTISGTVTLQIDPNATGGGTASDTELIVYNDYDELGQLRAKKVGGTPESTYDATLGLQTVDYTYNVRGWLTGINDTNDTDATLTPGPNDLFAFRIGYNEGLNPRYNGNITRTEWQTQNEDSSLKWYDYQYDALNRITEANAWTSLYRVANIGYDKNGNIEALTRSGRKDDNGGVMDDLTYTYDLGNKLLSVTDNVTTIMADAGFDDQNKTGNDYDYDDNGNLTMDRNKNIPTDGLTYNYLNLPTNISIDGGSITYIYDALGTKLQKTVSTGNTMDYAGNFIYENTDLQFISHSEGYATPKNPSNLSQGYDYVYQYKDHLGNVRLSYAEDPSNPGSPTIIEESNYYPFGLKHKGYNSGGDTALGNDVAQRWKFGGKEYQEELGLDWYDITARNYDPALGRWMNLDPLAEQMRRHSPYNFGFDNPIYWQDYDGMMPSGPGDPPKKKPKLRGNLTLGSGKTFGLKFKVFGIEAGFKIDRGTRSVTLSTDGENGGAQVTKGTSVNFGVFGYGKETSIDIKNTPSDDGGLNESGTKFENKGVSFEGTQTESETFTFLFGEGSGTTTTTGTVNVEESSTSNLQGFAGAMVNNATIADATSFEPDQEQQAEEGIESKLNLFGFEFNLGVRFEGNVEIDVPEDYGKDKPRRKLWICFVAGTQIEMSDGSSKNIEDVVIGDMVKSFNLSTQKLEDKPVLLVQESESYEFVKIKFKDGTTNINTLTHPYYVKNKGWSSYDKLEAERKYHVTVNQLEVGDIAYRIIEGNLKEVEIESIEVIKEKRKTYNLSNVKDNHNYFANGILVHNRS